MIFIKKFKIFRFLKANALVLKKYSEIEIKLFQRFHDAFYKNDRKEMKKYLNILSNFKVIHFDFICEFFFYKLS